LHRKAAGLYLLAAKLKARVDVRALFLPYASRQAPSWAGGEMPAATWPVVRSTSRPS